MIINDNEYEGSAIYRIVNQANNKIYISSTTNYKNRIHNHFLNLEAGRHENKELQNDYVSNKDLFVVEILRKYAHSIKNELFSREHEYIKAAKERGESLYNIQEMRNDYYLPFNNLVYKMADLYAKEHFNLRIGHFNTMPPAKIEMYYYLVDAKTPEEAAKIREQYAPAIEYQNKKEYYKFQLGLDYDDILELPDEERKEAIKRAKQERKHKTA